jgi:hypothetical protein
MISYRCFFTIVLLILLFWTVSVPAPSAEMKSLSSALHVLPHVGNDGGNVKDVDRFFESDDV